MGAATNLEALRQYMGFTREDFAEIIGLPLAAYCLAEVRIPIARSYRERIVKFFGSEFLGRAVLEQPRFAILVELGVQVIPLMIVRDPYR